MDCMRNRDAEIAAIGCAINDATCAALLAGMSEALFAHPDTQAVHRAVRRMVAAGDTVDLVTLATAARCDIAEPEILLIEAAQAGYLTASFRQYEAILHGCAKRRALAEAAQRILQDVNNPAADEDALCAEAVGVLQASEGNTQSTSMEQACVDFWQSISESKATRVFTGLPDLDRITGGFQPGAYVAIGARPGVGKSAFALHTAMNIVRTRGPVLLVSMEMAAHEIFARQVAAEAGVDGMDLITDKLDGDAYAAVAKAAGMLSREGLWINTRANTPLQVRREAVRLKTRHGLAAIVVDYIQLLQPDRRTSSRYEAVCDISRELKRLAMDLGIPVLVLTQFNRNSEAQMGQKARAPQMSESRDSGAIEQDANCFLILYPPPAPDVAAPGDPLWEAYHLCQMDGNELMEIIVDKNRSGRKGIVYVAFDKAHMRFRCIDLRRG